MLIEYNKQNIPKPPPSVQKFQVGDTVTTSKFESCFIGYIPSMDEVAGKVGEIVLVCNPPYTNNKVAYKVLGFYWPEEALTLAEEI